MPNLGNIGKTPDLLYRGVDWLRIGFYAEASPVNDYLTLLETLKDIIRFRDHEERIFEIPTVYPFPLPPEVDKPFPENLTFRVKTTTNIYPYIVMLVYEPSNIVLRLGRPLKYYQIEELHEGKTPTPNLMLELTGTSLRPQKYLETLTILKTLFYFLNSLGVQFLAFTFSRIDYALDFPNPERALNLLLTFERLQKIKIQTENEQITLQQRVKNAQDFLMEIAPKVRHIGVGNPRRLLVVYYLKTDADQYLKQLYFSQGFEYGDQIPHRIEVRLNTQFFTSNRKIYFLETPEEAINLGNFVNLSTEIVKEKIPQVEPFMTEEHPFFGKEPHQYFIPLLDKDLLTEAHKEVRKLSLYEEALRFLSQLIRLKENWNASAEELINTLEELIEMEHPKIVKKAKEKKMHIRDLLNLLPSLCK